MSDIFVTGHRNPDTDSIVASLAYASLQNAMGDRSYKAVRIGAINDETARLLARFGVEAPPFIKNMRTQVCDVDYDRTPRARPLRAAGPGLAHDARRRGQRGAHSQGGRPLFGMLSAGDIASYDMQTIAENRVDDVPLFNLLSVLEGTLVNELNCTVSSVSGELYIALPQNFDDPR